MLRSTASRLTTMIALVAVTASFVVLATADARPAAQEPDPQVLELGKTVYTDQCESCHGAEGKGDGPAARFLQPPARDLSAGEFEYATDGTVESVAGVVRSGVDDTGMTPFEGQLNDDEITAVATYVVNVLVKKDGGH
ncbi:MAG: cytochrome c [Acidobacteriota bacterium]